MNLPSKSFALYCLLLVPFFTGAGGAALEPRAGKFSAESLSLKDAIKELQDQTGNLLTDIRRNLTNPTIDLKPGGFWPSLDAIGKETGIGFSAYQEGGGVALVDTPYRKLTTHYSGLFRFAVKRTAVSRDDETQTHDCQVTLDAAWEPRFKAIYLNLDNAVAVYGKQVAGTPRESPRLVASTSATEIELRFKAPERKSLSIDSLKGSIRVIGVPKMLEFAFKGPNKAAEIDGVKVSATYGKQSATRWTVDIVSKHPEGALVNLESFQEGNLRAHDRVWLSWGSNPKTKKPYELEPSLDSAQMTDAGLKARYNFTARGETPLPPAGADVTLRYRTPSRVVAITVPFEFRDLPLP